MIYINYFKHTPLIAYGLHNKLYIQLKHLQIILCKVVEPLLPVAHISINLINICIYIY